MESRSRGPVVAVVVGLVSFCLCIICLAALIILIWQTDLLSFLPFFGPQQAASSIIPANTSFFVSVNPSLSDLAGYQHLSEVYGDIPEIEEAMEGFEIELLQELGISFEEDIRPWLGRELAMAIPDLAQAYEGQEPVVVLTIATRDRAASDVALAKILAHRQGQGQMIEKIVYQEVTYYIQQPEFDWEMPMIWGTVEGFVVLTTETTMMERVIDTALEEAGSLAENERYITLMDALPDDAVGYMFFDMAETFSVMLEDSGFELPSESADQVAAFQAAGMAVTLDPEGVLFDFVSTFDPEMLDPESLGRLGGQASEGRILQYVPADGLGFFSGQDLAAAWHNLFETLQQEPDFAMQLEDLEKALGIRIDEDLLGWMTGEYAFTVVETGGEQASVGALAFFEVDDLYEAESVLENILGVLESSGLEMETENIGGVEMQVLMDYYSGDILFGYGFIGQHLVIGFTEGALEMAVMGNAEPITDNEVFVRVTDHLPPETSGYVYIDVTKSWRVAYEQMPSYEKETFDIEVRPYLEPIQAVGSGVMIADPEDGVGRGQLFIYIP